MAKLDTTRGVGGMLSMNPMFARSGEVVAVPRGADSWTGRWIPRPRTRSSTLA
jgi:hypothetical protein